MVNANSAPAPPVKVTVYHNRYAPFMPYDGTHELIKVASHRLQSFYSDPVAVADWALYAFSTDLERLHAERHHPGGETTFLAACVYRLRHHRPLSVGDVVEVHVAPERYWLARDRWGWSSINPPRHLCKQPRSAATDPRRPALLPAPSSPRPAQLADPPPATGVDALVEHAVALGLTDSDLDDLVHDVASHTASAVNNEGIAGQVEYLVQQLGYPAALFEVDAVVHR
jgi:hypothetical protein